MPLLPDEVSAKTFRRRWWRGCDRHQVEAFLRDVAADYGTAISRVAALADERTRAQATSDELRRELDEFARSARDAAESTREEIQQVSSALGELRARVALLDQLNEVEQLIAMIHTDLQGICTTPQTPTTAASQQRDEPDQSLSGSAHAAARRDPRGEEVTWP